ncbi:MAG: YqzM-like protein [Bacillales bacterium]|jgi:hypothetical protein|nr:YqzM-like protein [Bacillales bacterium]MDF2945640.1 YqzM-like protein [Bacillales bacterium]
MNEFEKDVQCKSNDLTDSGVAFFIWIGFFATVFIVAQIIKEINL